MAELLLALKSEAEHLDPVCLFILWERCRSIKPGLQEGERSGECSSAALTPSRASPG